MANWSDKDIDFLLDNHKKINIDELSRKLNRTKQSVYHKISRLDINQTKRWKVSDVQFLRENYMAMSYKEMSNKLNKSEKSLTIKCHRLNLIKWDRREKTLIGQTFGKLLVISLNCRKSRQAIYNCICNCGKESTVYHSNLFSGDTQSCGNCKNYKNGVRFSIPQQKICESVVGELNYKVNNIFIDIALIEDKVAIEYDEWYWHKNKHDKDCARVNRLLNQEWKVITIRAHQNLPDIQVLETAIKEAKLAKNKYWQIITLEGWGK